jgi:hypothetical protein
MLIVVHFTASAMSSRDWISPVHRFPILDGYKGTSGTGAVGTARTPAASVHAKMTSAENIAIEYAMSQERDSGVDFGAGVVDPAV